MLDLTDKDRMVAAVERITQIAFDDGHCIDQDRHAKFANFVSHSLEFIKMRSGELLGNILLALAQNVNRENARF